MEKTLTLATNTPKRKKRKKSANEIVFMITMMAIPVIHFCVFWLYINVDSIFLSFKAFDMKTGVWKWTGFSNYVELYRQFTKRGQRFTKGIVQLVFGIPVERFYNSSPIAVLFVHAVQKDAFKQRFQGYILFALYNFRKRSYACLLVYA